jgi:predicted enzyme related to lactoylglutathione lyase
MSLFNGCQRSQEAAIRDDLSETRKSRGEPKDASMKIQYLEIVTRDVEKICTQYSKVHGVTFSDPDPNLGGARTATLTGGGLLGVRPPLRETETPVVRPYVLVDDIEASVAAAADAGGEVALPPMELQGHGTCAIVIQGGIECGLWQL